MIFKPGDWSGYSYREIQRLLEEYRENYVIKDNEPKNTNVKIIDETK